MKIQFDNVSFKYDDESVVFKNLNLTINNGEMVAILGHNGSGKSTIAKIIMGLLEVNEGSIYLNDELLTEDTVDKCRNNMSIIFQNPAKHLDLFGTLCLILFGFGWAKPVRVDPRYYKNQKWGMALVAIAGPLANFIIAMLGGLIYALLVRYATFNPLTEIVAEFAMYLVMINIGLGIFNLIPLPPLDGSKILGAFLPERSYYQYMRYQKYGMAVHHSRALHTFLSR